MDKKEKAFERYDRYNQRDPNVFVWEGVSYPQEYFFALQLHNWVLKLQPDASEELLLASRAQHIGRWEIPRETYPQGRVGYLTWRKDLASFHASKAAEILIELGYSELQVQKVEQIILKKQIKVNSEVQTMENALCLVFLQFQYEDFHGKHEPEKVIQILKKSLLKMDAHGHGFALQLQYSEKGLYFVKEALKLLAT